MKNKFNVIKLLLVLLIISISVLSFPSLIEEVAAEGDTTVRYGNNSDMMIPFKETKLELLNQEDTTKDNLVSIIEYEKNHPFKWVKKEVYTEKALPTVDTSQKCFMDYRTITDPDSFQYTLQLMATTDENGFRKIDGRYCVAVGTYYSSFCGSLLDITLENGTVIKCIVGDIKQDIHTDELHMYATASDNLVEFIIDDSIIPVECKLHGDMSYVNNFNGKVTGVKIVEYIDEYIRV